jgi:hypothetical protein
VNYDLRLARVQSITKSNGAKVLKAASKFIEENGYVLLGVNINFDVEDNTYTAFVTYEM